MTVGYNNTFNISKYKPQLGTIFGIAGAFFLMGSTANLDTGKQNGDWHVFCAGNAFVWSILSGWYHTYISCVLYNNTKGVSWKTTVGKVILSLAIVGQAVLDTQAKWNYEEGQLRSRLGNVLEYSIAFSTFGFYWLMYLDLKDFRLEYK